jgi:hypothetical protein
MLMDYKLHYEITGIWTCYRLDISESEPRWGVRDILFPTLIQRAPGPYRLVPALLSAGKTAVV